MPMTHTRIDTLFDRLRRDGRKGFIAYLTAGDPSPAETVRLVLDLEKAGVDLVELGLAFSDPLADGQVNQASAERALAAGATLTAVLEAVRRIRARSEIPLVLYSYLNPLLARGFEATVRKLARAGMDGLLALDLPVEEAAPYHATMRAAGLAPICLVTPTSTDARIRAIVRAASGFVYCVSRAGVTGARNRLDAGAGGVIARARRHTRLPLALGFGISTAAQTRQAARWADAVVVGSALVERLHAADGSPRARAAVLRWVAGLAAAAHRP